MLPLILGALLAQGPQKLQESLGKVGERSYGSAEAPDLPLLVGKIIQQILGLLGVIFMALTVYGGYLWFMARGNEEQVTKAKETIKAGIIGLAIMLSGYAISNFVIRRLSLETLGA